MYPSAAKLAFTSLLTSNLFGLHFVIQFIPIIMGTRKHGQERALALPPENVVKCFCALVVTAKRPVDELFMHYYHKLSSASGVFAPRTPPGLHPWTPLGDFCPHTPNLPTPEKKILRAPMPMCHIRGKLFQAIRYGFWLYCYRFLIDLWPRKPFQQRPLTWWTLLPSFIEILPLSTEI